MINGLEIGLEVSTEGGKLLFPDGRESNFQVNNPMKKRRDEEWHVNAKEHSITRQSNIYEKEMGDGSTTSRIHEMSVCMQFQNLSRSDKSPTDCI